MTLPLIHTCSTCGNQEALLRPNPEGDPEYLCSQCLAPAILYEAGIEHLYSLLVPVLESFMTCWRPHVPTENHVIELWEFASGRVDLWLDSKKI